MRPVTPDEWRAFFTMLSEAFGEDQSDEDFDVEVMTAEAERSLAVFDGDELVATAGAFTFTLTVPGGTLPAAGVTYVGVRPTHRRRGILTSMMDRQLRDVHDRGEPIAVLWASEAAIYGRFGYGLASSYATVEVDRLDASLRRDLPTDPALRLRAVAPADAYDDIARIEAQTAAERPGTMQRSRTWIEQFAADTPSRKRNNSSLRCLVAEAADGTVEGYVLYRTNGDYDRVSGLPKGSVLVLAQAATTTAASVALTRSLLSIDLMRTVRWWNQPVDSVLPHLLADPRHARTTVKDALHLRIVDVAAALAGRRYVVPLDVVLGVRDERLTWNDGSWRLTVDDTGTAKCAKVDDRPEITLGVEELGAAFLGGTSLLSLAAAGRVETADAEALARVGAGFGWPVAPWCPIVF